MHIIETPAYREAFTQYLRKGIPIELSLKMHDLRCRKMLGASTHYIWHTQDDGKVRPKHAANNNKIFAWNNPPATGHPGDDFNCRCWAEPIGDSHYIRQFVITPIDDSASKWEWVDFVFHYYFGNGVSITLSQAGLFNAVVNLAHAKGVDQVGEGVEIQVLEVVKNTIGNTSIVDTFSNGYNFYDVAFVLRISEVYGKFIIKVDKNKRYFAFQGIVEYHLKDYFQDPIDIMEGITMLPKDIMAFIQKIAVAKSWDEEILAQIYEDVRKISPKDIFKWIHTIADLGGKPYSITGNWKTKIIGTTAYD